MLTAALRRRCSFIRSAFSSREEAERYNVEIAERRLYIIRNARFDPTWAQVDRQALRIAGRAIGTLIQSQGSANLFWLYVIAQRDDIDYNLAFISRGLRHTESRPVRRSIQLSYGRATRSGLGQGDAEQVQAAII